MTYEGDPRVPAIIRWLEKVKSGRVDPGLVGMPDIYRTMLAVGVPELPRHKLDEYEITGFLTGKSSDSPTSEYFSIPNDRFEAVRSGDWKLRTVSGTLELFDLQLDVSEKINRAADLPEKVFELRLLMTKM